MRRELDAGARVATRRSEAATHELHRCHDVSVEGWCRALALRDAETEEHGQRVAARTVQLARRAGLREEALVHVRRGALLHDIGKIGVPDAILHKPGPLGSCEWAVMKRHTTYALELLVPIPFLRPAIDIPHAHHERWDGAGYPRGLRGEQIPLPARLFAVVDVYDALTSDRPYRAAWGEERAVAHVREQAGSHFDPAAVDAFVAILMDEGIS